MQTSGRQGGLVIRFIAVGVILVGILLGGIYGVKHLVDSGKVAKTPTITKPASNMPTTLPGETSSAQRSPDSSSSPSTQSAVSSVSSDSSTELPHTGSMESLQTALIIAMLTAMILYYLQSRRMAMTRL